MNLLRAQAIQLDEQTHQGIIKKRFPTVALFIRNNVANGLAVVPVERGASGGSFFVIPPQVQMEIASRKKKIITDEHSGRILIDPALAEEEKEKMKQFLETL